MNKDPIPGVTPAMTLHRIITIAALTLTVAPAASAATGSAKRCVAPPTANVDHGAAVMKVTANLKRGPYQGPAAPRSPS
ncbi:hypothetical protein [Nonomuraea endophytica]|uniref:hypothetical protein n=1 Tax=Nonomuraea endophytica TaxID=714136 RepID=UPI0037CCBA80